MTGEFVICFGPGSH